MPGLPDVAAHPTAPAGQERPPDGQLRQLRADAVRGIGRNLQTRLPLRTLPDLRVTATATTKTPAIPPETTLPYRLALDIRAIEMTEEQFLQLCSDNGDLRLEITAKSELIIIPPTWSTASRSNSRLNQQLANWSDSDGTGIVFDSNGGFTLPSGAVRAPDASWILLSRWEVLTSSEQAGFARICPDFVVELRSPSDRLSDVQDKMAEYLDNGTRLG